MSYVRMALALVAAACATAAISAEALASQFIAARGADETGAFALKGASGTEGVQKFRLGGLEVRCSALARGWLSAPGQDLDLSLAFKKCTTEVDDGLSRVPVKVKMKGAMQLQYSAAGDAWLLAPVTVDVKGLGCSFELTAYEEEGYVEPGYAQYTNEKYPTSKLKQFPSGFQHELGMSTNLSVSALETGPCGPKGPGGEGAGKNVQEPGDYEGAISVAASGANLGIEEGEEGPPEGWNLEQTGGS